MENFIQSDAAKAVRMDLQRHALEATPDIAAAASILLAAAGEILAASFGIDEAARIISDSASAAASLRHPAGSA